MRGYLLVAQPEPVSQVCGCLKPASPLLVKREPRLKLPSPLRASGVGLLKPASPLRASVVGQLKPPWSSPVEWCNRFVSFGLGYALSWSGVSSCPVGCGVSRDLVRMSRLR